MDDDIDDLLNEVEDKFCASASKGKGKTNKSVIPLQRKETTDSLASTRSDINAMIADIIDTPEPLKRGENRKTSPSCSTGSTSGSLRMKKCFPLYLGGSSCPQGLATTVSKRTCDQLRCTDCDFKVVGYDDYRWDPTVDYLFLRNNMPDFSKLQPKLTRKKGSRAYGCQCKSVSVKELGEAQKVTEFKWVCGKH